MHKEQESLSPKKIALFAIVGLNLLLTLYVAFFKNDTIWFETLKAGGSENFTKLEKFLGSDSYKAQQTTMINQYVQGSDTQGAATEGKDTTAANTDTNAAPAQNIPSLDTAKIDAIVADGFIKGNKDARYLVLEYSDLLCPFCKRHYNAQTVENFVKNHDDVAMIFRQNPIPGLHPTAPKGANGVYCAGKIGGKDTFYSFLDKAFQIQEFTDENLLQTAKDVGLNATKFASCYADAATIAAVNAQITEGTQFGVQGTPGNVLIDRKTGKYILIAGAYPIEKFEEEFKNLQK